MKHYTDILHNCLYNFHSVNTPSLMIFTQIPFMCSKNVEVCNLRLQCLSQEIINALRNIKISICTFSRSVLQPEEEKKRVKRKEKYQCDKYAKWDIGKRRKTYGKIEATILGTKKKSIMD